MPPDALTLLTEACEALIKHVSHDELMNLEDAEERAALVQRIRELAAQARQEASGAR